MPMKGSGAASDWRRIDSFDGGIGWLPYPDEEMQRACHAVVGAEGGVWVVDPVDVPGLDDLLAELGEVAGVVIGLDRHKRDCAAVASRHDVSVYVPREMRHVVDDLAAPTELFYGELGDSGFEALPVVDNRFWTEVALFDGETLVVPESVGTAPYFRTKSERLGVHPMLRLFPPTGALEGLHPDRVLVGHGEGVMTDASQALGEALRGSRRNAPSLALQTVKRTLS